MSRIIVALAACFTIIHVAQGADRVILFNSSWKYMKGTAEASSPASAWRGLVFNDGGWSEGTAPFYYGENLTGTLLDDMQGSYSCVFARKSFPVADPNGLAGLRLEVLTDDGFVAWINGTEVFRYNMPIGEPTRSTLASIGIEPELRTLVLSNLTGLLVAGQNVLAVQGFNNSLAGSSDFVLDAALTTYVPDTGAPVIVSVTPERGTTISELTEITVTFNEPVTGVEASSLLINGNTPSAVSGGGTTWTFGFPHPPYGPVQVSWFEHHGIYDEALYANRFDHTAAGATWEYTLVDQKAPTIANLFPPAGATVRSLSQVEVTFSEEVTGLDAADLLVNGQAATNLVNAGGGPFTFQFAAPAAGLVEVTWAADPGITDFAQPPNAFVPVGWSYQLDPNAAPGELVITEILAANQTGLVDEDGEPEDWIELQNRGGTPVNLTGWSLSDDPDDPGRWVFGSRTVGPGEYLVVFASGKDRRNPAGGNRFHTNFRLANGGEFLGLYTPDSPRILASGFSPEFPEQRNDHSYGYDSEGALRYFAAPTPGTPNGASTILSITEGVLYSVQRGFYSNAFDLYLSSPTPGAAIRYTVDGLEPTPTVGLLYMGPLRITNSAMIRAVAFRANFLPSRVSTHSYLFNFTAPRRALPVINLVMPLSNWYGRSGILGMGGGSRAGDGLYITNNPATDYHNPNEHGIAWERPVSAEYIVPGDNSGFQIDCGIRVQGSDWQRPRTTESSKFSYRLYFRGDYGRGELNYQLFPLSKVRDYDQVVLRAGFNEQINPFIRDEIIRRMSQDMGQAASIGGLALVLRNGGIYTNNLGLLPVYNPCERVHEAHLQRLFGGGPEWDVVGPSFARSAEGLGIIDGDRIDFANLLTNAWTGSAVRPLTNQVAYQTLARRLELVNFVDYCLLNAYTAMGDWPANNWRAARERKPGAIWRFFVWDAEWGMGIYNLQVTRDSFALAGTGTEDAGLASVVNSEIARLYQALRPNPEFRLLWADRIHKHFFNGGALTGLNISNRFHELASELVPSFSPAQNMDIEILQWAQNRFPIVMNQFNTYGLYGYSNALYGIFASSNAPAFNQHGGRVGMGFSLTMSAPLGGTIYYTTNGDDPRVPFTGAVSNSAVAYSGPVEINQTMVIKARALLDGTNWSALAEAEFTVDSLIVPLRITEIMYNPVGGSAYEFIELQNYGGTPLNLAGMSFDGINFTFPVGSVLDPGARLVLASDASPGNFAARYPGVAVAGYFGGALNNAGETITLRDAAGKTIISVTYDNGGLWPASANGGGYSLVLAGSSGDPDDPLNWSASPAQGGSPGEGDIFPGLPAGVVLSEISAASSPQWIEVHNPTGGSFDLAGYSLTDDGNPRKYVLPSLTIGPNQYLLIEVPTNIITLSARGDEVLLYDANTNLLSAISYGLQPAGYTLSRVGVDWTLGQPTPNAENVAASLGPASGLVINEWLANALSSEDDWIELWNNSPQPVALQGIYIAVTNRLFRIGSRSYIGPHGFVQLFADEDPGPDHLDFRLPASGARITLYDYVGVEINRVTYGAQAENVSQGRLPDGASTIQTFPGSPSPGAPNYVIVYNGPYINEVMARNVSAVTNALGRVVDWIEIFNPGAGSFDLSGMSLSMDAPEPFQWVFPSGTVISPSSHLVVWCDGDTPASTSFEATLNSGQSLRGEGGGVYLFSAAGQLVNFIEYGFQLQNQSIGRVATQVRLLQAFTPGTANAPAATLGSASGVTFNEWMADPLSGDDWFELYNSGTLPVDVGGMAITDDPSLAGQGKFRVAPLSFIPPRGWVRFEADGNPANAFDHVNFSLDAAGEALRLYTVVNNNYILVTATYFGPQSPGISEGRLPDGGATIVRFPGSATPGQSNYQLPGNVVINEVQASTGQIELYNPTGASADIGGWYLSNSRLDYKLYRIPDGTSVPAGGYTVVTPAGFSLNPAVGGEVILAAADGAGNLYGQRVHESFGPQAAGISFGRFATSLDVRFVALAEPTLGAANSAALVGPIVINEIMYNPLPDGLEYIELLNISPTGQSLAGWALANAVDVPLPEMILPAGGYLVLGLFPDHGRLDNAGERLDLFKPGGILVDSVDYEDSSPWPSGPVDGGGLSLQRRDSTQYGDDPFNWVASEPTPEDANGAGTVPLPVITAPPQSVTTTADSIVTFSVEASGGAPLGYQWRFNGIEIPGATTPDFTLNYAQLEHNGSYDVLVSNPAGSALSSSATLTINSPPIILVGPQTQTIATNTSTTLTVAVRGSPPISYQWRLNGVTISGATGSSYTINNADLEHMGEYSVLVSNPFGSVISSAEVFVLVAPRFLVQPLSQTVVEGDDATFRTVVVGMPPMGFRWRRVGASTITNGIGFDTPILTLTNVRVNYTNIFCIATNPARFAGIGSANAQLVVLADSDQDGLPDVWENQHNVSDAMADPDQDGLNNRQEYLAGTDPNDPESYLRIESLSANFITPAVLLSFKAASNKTYTVRYRDTLAGGDWTRLLDVEGALTERLIQITDQSPNATSRFYQLMTPAAR